MQFIWFLLGVCGYPINSGIRCSGRVGFFSSPEMIGYPAATSGTHRGCGYRNLSGMRRNSGIRYDRVSVATFRKFLGWLTNYKKWKKKKSTMKLSNNSYFVILIFAILKFLKIDRSTRREFYSTITLINLRIIAQQYTKRRTSRKFEEVPYTIYKNSISR